jgi:enoyl-CoA hydratase/carnithine racemase
MAGTQYLPRAVGIRRAREIVLTGNPFSAPEALAWGLVNKVCELDVLLDQTRAQAERIISNGPIAIREARRALNHAVFADLKAGYQVELEAYNRTVPTTDRREGIAAFNEKRKPVFKGE